jgi:hypothetical protein
MEGGADEQLLLRGVDGDGAMLTRWWVLTIYSFSSGLQALLWMTYSSVPDHSKSYLNVGDKDLQNILEEGPWGYMVMAFFASWLFTTKGGLKKAVLLSCFMCFAAAFIRVIPCFLHPETRRQHESKLLWIIYVAQLINASAAPLTQASCSLLSQLWFPPSQRATATAFARQSNAGGRAIGFFLGPALVKHAKDLPRLLYIEVVLAAVPLLAALIYFPAAPKVPPSESAKFLYQNEQEDGAQTKKDAMLGRDGNGSAGGTSAANILRDCKDLLLQPSRLGLLVLAFGVQMGVYGAWSGVLVTVLTGSNEFTNSQAGLLGSLNTFAGIFGGVVIGVFCDYPALATKLKSIMLLLCGTSCGTFLLLALAVHPFSLLGAHVSFASICTLSWVAGRHRCI